MKTLKTLVHAAVTSTATRKSLPWAGDANRINKTVQSAVDAVIRACPGARVDGDSIVLGKHDHDDRFNPVPQWFDGASGRLTMKGAA